MRSRVLVATVAAIVLALVPVGAQWPAFPDKKVPLKADGTPNLEAPTPRTPDGTPDLTGVWLNEWFYGGQVRRPPAALPGEPPPSTFGNIGANFPNGLPLQPWAAKLRDERKAAGSKENPDAHCLPMGLMQFHEHPQPRKMIQTPDVLVILYEGNAGLRQIFTDGRPVPKNDPQPWWYGYSVGRWEGDTLVVETTGLRDGGWLDIDGTPQTDAAKITERYRRLNYGTLKIDVTIDDPKAYTAPFSVRVNQKLMVDERMDAEIIEFICGENEKDVEHMKFLGRK
ncbi:MAG TPA: hypothetical protein VGQ37_08455 [Vicinamibacterales bacterium]|jgi:hypothetical protein|nr:hypothetical protein [Vicinamibacterales bacterium]